jgi:hypothetical protein
MPEYQPKIPPRIRAIVYWTTFAVSAVAAVVTGLAPIWLAEIAPQILATAGVATTVMGVIGGGLGVAYRPTKQAESPAAPAPSAAPAPAPAPAAAAAAVG